MKTVVPSFRFQIFLVFIILLLVSILFTRTFFIKSNDDFLQQIAGLDLSNSLDSLYNEYKNLIPSAKNDDFSNTIEGLLRQQNYLNFSIGLYRQQIKVYSQYIFIFILVSMLILFLLSINLITRPLKRLQGATQELQSGNNTIQIKENRFSPINDVIVSFNSMVRALDQQRRLAIEAEKKLVWREIARVMAHEIKNPLTPIKLSVERLEMALNSGAPVKPEIINSAVAIVKEEVDNLKMLVERFRGFASLPEANPEYYNIASQIDEIIGAYLSDHKIIFETSGEVPSIYADKIQIKQVLVNLIQNAIQSGVDVNLQIKIILKADTECIILEIQDNGPGISPENMARIFEPYFTTRRKGTGLGLPIVKQIVENHSGNIILTSHIGSGTIVTLKFPIKTKAE